MTSPAKIQARVEFGQRLNRLMDALNWDKVGRPEQLRDLMVDAGSKLTYETARTWVAGKKSPSGAHLQIMCKVLGANANYLMHDAHPMFDVDPADPGLAQLQREWPTLDEEGRQFMLQSLAMAKRAPRPEEQRPAALKKQPPRATRDEAKTTQVHRGRTGTRQ